MAFLTVSTSRKVLQKMYLLNEDFINLEECWSLVKVFLKISAILQLSSEENKTAEIL